MLPTFTVLGGLLIIVLESVGLRLFGVLVWAPQLAVMAVAYVGLRRSFAQAAVATLLFAGVADICWGGPRGYYALGLTATFFAAAAIRARVGRPGTWQVVLLMLPAVIVTDLVALTTLALFHRGASPLNALLTVSPLTALWTAAVALPLVWLMGRIESFVERRGKATL